MNDREAAELYGKPGAIKAGARVPIAQRRMTGHVPVRFPSTTIERIKSLAAEDGMTVSTWIRKIIDQAIIRRVGQYTACEDQTKLSAFNFEGTNRPASTATHTSILTDA